MLDRQMEKLDLNGKYEEEKEASKKKSKYDIQMLKN